jgi:hypothetical protein
MKLAVETTKISAKEALRLHRLYRGKIQVAPKCPIRGARWASATSGRSQACR